MTTRNYLLQRQLEIIQLSENIASEYETGRTNAEVLLKRDKETAESTRSRSMQATTESWKRDRTTTELNWSRTQVPVDSAIRVVREIFKSTQDILNKAKVQGILSQSTSLKRSQETVAMPNASNLVEQMSGYQSTAEQASRQIKTALGSYTLRGWSFIAGFCGFVIAIALYSILMSSLAGFFNETNAYAVLIITCLLTFVSTSILIYTLIYTLRIQSLLTKLRKPYADLLQVVVLAEDLYNEQLPDLEKSFKHQIDEGQARYKVTTDQIEAAYQRQLNESQTRYNQTRQQLEQMLQQNVQGLRRDIETFRQEGGFSGADWNAPIWKQWQPLTPTSSLMRLCTVTLSSPMGNLPPLPLFVSCPGGENILFKATDIAKNTAIEAIQSFMFRLLATQPPGVVRFTLIDPVALGQNVAGFMQLADYDEALVGGRPWIQPGHIEQQLVDLTEHMGNVIRKYLRGQYKSLEEYKRAGGFAEPYRILVVMDFPANFSTDSARRLVNIATNGPRCGVSTIVMVDTRQPIPPGFNLADLEQVSTVIAWNGQQFVWGKKDQSVVTH